MSIVIHQCHEAQEQRRGPGGEMEMPLWTSWNILWSVHLQIVCAEVAAISQPLGNEAATAHAAHIAQGWWLSEPL